MARSLEQAVKHSECYENSNNTMAATISHPEAVHVATIRKNIQQSSACFFCGNPRHSRLLYPARNAECKKCKKGHWAKVCVVITRTISLRARLQPLGIGIHTHTLPI